MSAGTWTDPAVDDVAAYDPEAFFEARRAAQPEMLRLRRGERFLASEATPLYAEMHGVLDEIVAEQLACEAFEAARAGR